MQSEVDSSGLHSERGCKNELSPEVKPFLRIIELADFWRWAKRDQENPGWVHRVRERIIFLALRKSSAVTAAL